MASFLEQVMGHLVVQPQRAPESARVAARVAPSVGQLSHTGTLLDFVASQSWSDMMAQQAKKFKSGSIELELRFGSLNYSKKDNQYHYFPSITEISYHYILLLLENLRVNNPEGLVMEESKYDVIQYGIEKYKNMREVIEYTTINALESRQVNRSYHAKTPLETWMVGTLPIRVSVSHESESKPMHRDVMAEVKDSKSIKVGQKMWKRRRIFRKSYTVQDPHSLLYGWTIDLSNVTTTTLIKTGNDKSKMLREVSFELEFERDMKVPWDQVKSMAWPMIFGLLFSHMRMTHIEGLFLPMATQRRNQLAKEHMAIVRAMAKDHRSYFPWSMLVDALMDGHEYAAFLTGLNTYLYQNPNMGGFSMRALNKPVDIKLNHLIDPQFDPYVTAKVDGHRCILAILQGTVALCTQSGAVPLILPISRPGLTYPVTRSIRGQEMISHMDLPNAIFDAELYTHYENQDRPYTIFVFDCLMINDIDTRSWSMAARLEKTRSYPYHVLENPPFAIQFKSYQTPFDSTIPKQRRDTTGSVPSKVSLTDAIRLQPPQLPENVHTDGFIFYTNDPYIIPSQGVAGPKYLSLIEQRLAESKARVQEQKQAERERIAQLHDYDLEEDGDDEEAVKEESKKPKIRKQLGPTTQFGQVYKYKPPHQLTIDFLVVETKDHEYFLQLHSRPDQKKSYTQFVKMMKRKLYLFSMDSLTPNDDMMMIVNRVGEFRFDKAKDVFVLERLRPDKSQGNNIKVAWDVWRDIQKPIEERTITGQDLVLMRRFHNIYKTQMINKYARRRVLVDIGSGRGGDLLKWQKASPTMIYALEPNDENRAEFEKRYSALRGEKPTVQLLDLGGQDAESILEAVDISKVQVITSFFSLTYFFSDKFMMDGLMAWLKECPYGTRFIGAMLDGGRVMDALNRERKRQGLTAKDFVTWKNDAFTIEQTAVFDPTEIFGNSVRVSIHDPDSMVQDQVEYLTSYTYLRDELQKIGFVTSIKAKSKLKGRSEDHFLDASYSDMFTVLNTYGQEFSALNRYFIFVKMSEPASAKVESTVPIQTIKQLPTDVPEGTVKELTAVPPITPNARYIVIRPDVTGYHPLMVAVFYQTSQFRQWSQAHDVDKMKNFLDRMSRKIRDNMSEEAFSQYLDGRLYSALAWMDVQERTLHASRIDRPSSIEPLNLSDAYERFKEMIVSPEDSQRLAAPIMAHLISDLIKKAVMVLTTMGDYWAVTEYGLTLEEALDSGYREAIVVYHNPKYRFMFYPLQLTDHLGAIRLTPLRSMIKTQTAEQERADDLYYRAVNVIEVARGLSQSVLAPPSGHKKSMQDPKQIMMRLEGFHEQLNEVSRQLQEEATDEAMARLESVESIMDELNQLRDRIKDSLRGAEMVEEDAEPELLLVPREEQEPDAPFVDDVVPQYEEEEGEMAPRELTYDPRFG